MFLNFQHGEAFAKRPSTNSSSHPKTQKHSQRPGVINSLQTLVPSFPCMFPFQASPCDHQVSVSANPGLRMDFLKGK